MGKGFWRNIVYSGYDLDEDKLTTKRIKLLNVVSIIGFPVFIFFMFVNYELGQTVFALVNLTMTLLLLYGFIVLRKSIDYMEHTIVAIFLSLFASFGVTLFQGGILNSGFVWFFLFPIIALFLKKRAVAMRWIQILIGSILVFAIYAISSKFSLPYDPAYLFFIVAGLGIEVLILSVWQGIQEQFETALSVKSAMLEELTKDLEKRVEIEVAKSHYKDEILAHQSKLAAMGEMMNNIAHQWKQPLGTINVLVQNMQLSLMLDDEINIDASLEGIIKQTKLMNQSVYDFLNFSKPTGFEEPFDINKAVLSTIELIGPRLNSEHIVLKYEPFDEGYELFGKKNEFMHVLMNLLSNAREALRDAQIEEPWIAVRLFRDAEQIVLHVEDNAGGIASDVMEHIFELYFTTKADKGGTGLGLAMSKKIVEENFQGNLTASNSQWGALFELRVNCANCVQKESE